MPVRRPKKAPWFTGWSEGQSIKRLFPIALLNHYVIWVKSWLPLGLYLGDSLSIHLTLSMWITRPHSGLLCSCMCSLLNRGSSAALFLWLWLILCVLKVHRTNSTLICIYVICPLAVQLQISLLLVHILLIINQTLTWWNTTCEALLLSPSPPQSLQVRPYGDCNGHSKMLDRSWGQGIIWLCPSSEGMTPDSTAASLLATEWAEAEGGSALRGIWRTGSATAKPGSLFFPLLGLEEIKSHWCPLSMVQLWELCVVAHGLAKLLTEKKKKRRRNGERQ